MRYFTPETMENKFTHHAPDKKKAEIHAFIRHEAFKFATAINENCPGSAESVKAVNAVEEAMFWANAAIARHKLDDK